MTSLHLIVTVAGAGSRFAELGLDRPKPVIELLGKPFFQWAAESVLRRIDDVSLTFVSLAEHKLREQFIQVYPDAAVLELPKPTTGAAETAWCGAQSVPDGEPVGFLDCDLSFDAPTLPATLGEFRRGNMDGALCVFQSQSPNYSYAIMNQDGLVTGTVEKRAASPWAIAGLYLFANVGIFNNAYDTYRHECPYNELFMSGVYNVAASSGLAIGLVPVERYVSFGTPEEYKAAQTSPYLREQN